LIKLYNEAGNTSLGEITEEQLKFLQDQFEEEWSGDQDYYINRDTIDMLERAGADSALLSLLRNALSPAGEVDIRWSRE
jgi:hypothetical protein